MQAKNPVLAWLEGNTPPPINASIEQWKRAALQMLSTLRGTRTQISTEQSWDAFETMERAYVHMATLCQMHTLVTYQHDPAKAKDCDFAYRDLQGRLERFYRGSARHACSRVLQGWLQRKREPLNKQERRRVEEMLSLFREAKAQKRKKDPIATLERQYFQQSERWMREQKLAPFLVSRGEISAMPAPLRKICRSYGKSLGLDRPCLPPVGGIGVDIAQHFPRPERRALAQQYIYPTIVSDDHINSTIDRRTSRQRHEGHTSFAHSKLADASITSPRKLKGLLAEGIEIIAPLTKRLYRATEEALERMGYEGTPGSLDVRWALTQVLARNAKLQEIPDAFPVESTLKKAIPELVACGNWTAGKPVRIHGNRSDGWLWPLVHEDGREADLAVFPSIQPSSTDALSSCAENMNIRGYWCPGQPTRAMASVHMFSATKRNYFNVEDLATLAHEVGHALHGLVARQDQDVSDGMSNFGWDFVEFPSQLLELYPSDPRVLARWSNSRNNPEWAKPAAWVNSMYCKMVDLPQHCRHWLIAWSDLSIHSVTHRTPSLDDHYAKSLKRFGLPEDYEPDLARQNFCWDDYAGQWFSYPLGRALAGHITPMRSDGTTDAKLLKRVMQSLLRDVLQEGNDPKKFRKKMEEWTGENFEDVLRKAVRVHMLRQKAHMVACTQAIKQL